MHGKQGGYEDGSEGDDSSRRGVEKATRDGKRIVFTSHSFGGQKRDTGSGGKEGQGGGDNEGDGGRNIGKSSQRNGGKGFTFGKMSAKKGNVDAMPNGSNSSMRNDASPLTYRDKLLSPSCAGFLVKHSEEDDIVQGWKNYFHQMNEKENQRAPEESDEDDDVSTEGLDGKLGILKFTAEEYTAWCLPWMNSLIIKVLGATFPTYLIRIGGPWMIEDHYLIVQRWRPNFNPWKADLQCNIVAWIRLLDVPFEFYNVESLRRIGNMVGKMVKIDRSTSVYDKGVFARICVEIDLKKPLLPTYTVFKEERPIIYEGLHQVCFACAKYGNKKEGCQLHQTKVQAGEDVQRSAEEGSGVDGGTGAEIKVGGPSASSFDETVPYELPFGKIRISQREFRGSMNGAKNRGVVNEDLKSAVDQRVSGNKSDDWQLKIRKDIKIDIKGNKGELGRDKCPPKAEWIQVGVKRKNVNKAKPKGKENRPPSRPRGNNPPVVGLDAIPKQSNPFSALQSMEAQSGDNTDACCVMAEQRTGLGCSDSYNTNGVMQPVPLSDQTTSFSADLATGDLAREACLGNA
ncbi:hypothetical protein K1719_046778 [Acacia pycnantha]|nr:hypothetical protein K1719_046778 [Acacia pycnantha]